ncbi:hypothetical protein [Lacticaseibacillus parakribbianus]|uniref:hypothetical protein n=1 Tax=Lacticaseibacillus parakribbianus TaxID=2970927 RepID=UPI0021CB1BD8|nr:hypothetical protein [Lacticaseibacillus parakribbianus]
MTPTNVDAASQTRTSKSALQEVIVNPDQYMGTCVLFSPGSGTLPQKADFGFKGEKTLVQVVYVGNGMYEGFYQ